MRFAAPLLALCAALAGCARAPESAAGMPAADGPDARPDLRPDLRVEELERRLASERTAHAAERERLECELADLRGELVRREEEFLDTLGAVGRLAPGALPDGWVAASVTSPVAPAEGPIPAVAEAEETPAREGELDAARLRSLRNLLAIEDVYGLDLLEIGSLASGADGERGATGPVVFRLLDGRGRPAGSLFAERLRLEGSRAARTVTIVLEDGYELRGGEKTSFDGATDGDADAGGHGRGGVRRLRLAHVDPRPWIEAVPELFGPKAAAEPDDDGRHDLFALRASINRLLAQDAEAGYWELDDFAGCVGDELRKVALRGRDRDGKLERMLFADRLRFEADGSGGGGVRVVLEDGAQVRGSEKAPFLDGRFRIFLPRADLARWRAAGVPGLAAPGEVAGAER